MRKVLSIPLFVLSLLILGVFTPKLNIAHASPDFDITHVSGQVTGPDGKPFKDADIVIICDGQTDNTKTRGNGNFNKIFIGKNTCEAGDTVTVTATKDGVSGSGSGIVVSRRDGRFVDVNFSVINFSVPEFGLLTGAVALIGSAGTFYALRKRV